jgi:hypothetical protein
MSITLKTLRNAQNRRRFVTPELAEPYLTARERANLTAKARRLNDQIEAAFRASQYATPNRQHRARRLAMLTRRLVEIEDQLARFPTPGEVKRRVRTTTPHLLAA